MQAGPMRIAPPDRARADDLPALYCGVDDGAVGLRPTDRVLEIGTGCGYQTAVLAALVREVCTVERVEGLARTAGARMAALGMTQVALRVGDGREGWAERAPFDCIMVTAAPDQLPAALGAQLAPGGRLVIPLGGRPLQWLHRFTARRTVACATRIDPGTLRAAGREGRRAAWGVGCEVRFQDRWLRTLSPRSRAALRQSISQRMRVVTRCSVSSPKKIAS
ncbi:MAG: hypothetical protein IPL39_14650 [Opitutaceae bacterium]|nr:hypothetical protein [Opitutaceae bacterium]